LTGEAATRFFGGVGRSGWLAFVEARPVVQGIFLLRFFVGASFAGALLEGRLVGGALAWACVTLAVYIFNGAMDVLEDRVNASGRPIASGRLGRGRAAGMAAGLGVLGVAGGAALGLHGVAWAAVAALALGWAYSAPPLRLKRWPAGLAAVAVSGMLLTYHAGHAANGGGTWDPELTAFAVAMALWAGLVGQAKDLSDVEGDRQAGRKSLPVARGERAARRAVSGAALAVAAGFLVAAGLLPGGGLVVAAVVLAAGAGAVAALALGPWGRGDRVRCRRPYRAFMLAQYGAHLAVLVL